MTSRRKRLAGQEQKFPKKSQACDTLNTMSAPVLPKEMQNTSPKPFQGIKRPNIKVLKPISLVEVFEKIRKE
jgi:hypothetical protein